MKKRLSFVAASVTLLLSQAVSVFTEGYPDEDPILETAFAIELINHGSKSDSKLTEQGRQ